MSTIYPIIKEGVYKYCYDIGGDDWRYITYTPVLTPPKNEYSAIYFKIAKAHEKTAIVDCDLLSGRGYAYTLDASITSSTDCCYSDSSTSIQTNYLMYAYRESPTDFPIVTYTFILLNPYDQKCIQHLKKIYTELTNDTPLIGWDDENMKYIYRTEEHSPFINKKELEELIYKLEHDEDILPMKDPLPTPSKEIDSPEPVKQSISQEPKDIHLRESSSQETIKDAPKECTERVISDEDDRSKESSDDDDNERAPNEEIKTKVNQHTSYTFSYDEPVKAPSYPPSSDETLCAFLIMYGIIMTVLVIIGMARP